MLTLVSDPNSLVQATALRLLEPFAATDKAVQTTLGQKLLNQKNRATGEQALQMALTARALDADASQQLLADIVGRYGTSPLIRDAVLSSLQDGEFTFLQRLWTLPNWQTREPAKEIFLEMLTTAIVRKRDPAELTALLGLLDTPEATLGWQQKAVVAGLSIGGGAGQTETRTTHGSPPHSDRREWRS